MNKSNPRLADMVITEAMLKNMKDMRNTVAYLKSLVYDYNIRERATGTLNHFDATLATIEGMMK